LENWLSRLKRLLEFGFFFLHGFHGGILEFLGGNKPIQPNLALTLKTEKSLQLQCEISV
jgi:hypothetical protein